jgi:hypothetical protein
VSDTPLRLADGSLVYKNGQIVAPRSEAEPTTATTSLNAQPSDDDDVRSEFDASRLVIPVQRRLRDLPENTRTMNGIAAVLGYTLFGLSDDDIAEAIGTTTDRIVSIRQLPSYQLLRNDAITNVISAEQSDVRELFVKHSRKAVHTVVEGMNAKKTSDRLKAAGDILDRSGFRPADVVEHRHRLEGGLTIEIVRKTNTVPIVNIDVEDLV